MDEQKLTDCTAIAVVGHRGSGKTALTCALLEQVKDRDVYVYQHPKPDLLEARGWRQMYRLEQMYDITNAVVWIDEPQISIPTLDKRANDGLQRLLSIARHRDITLVISTCDTRWITRALESYVDVWIIKDVESRLVKQGSMIGRIIKKHCVVDVDGFRLGKHQYLAYSRDREELPLLNAFTLPDWFDDEWSKPYSQAQNVQTAPIVAPKVRPPVSTNGVVLLGQTNGVRA